MQFPQITEHIFLNFVNTRLARRQTVADLLTVESWSEWLKVQQGLAYADVLQFLQLDTVPIAQLTTLRDTMVMLTQKIVAAEMTPTQVRALIVADNKQNPFHTIFLQDSKILVPEFTGIVGLKTVLLQNLADLLVSGYKHIKHCANPECVLFFYDTGSRRKWCAMQICGNRAKVKKASKKPTA